MNIYDLPEIGSGDWGPCVFLPVAHGEHPRLVWYDDDDYWCSDGRDVDDPYHECGDGGSPVGCALCQWAVIYPEWHLAGPRDVAFHRELRDASGFFDGNIIRGGARQTETRTGFVYALALVPELDLCRIKVGYTRRASGARIAEYRTANPTAMLLGAWHAEPTDEDRVHDILDGRIGTSEVFQVRDLATAITAIDRAISRGDL